jgi:hypothetical protein
VTKFNLGDGPGCSLAMPTAGWLIFRSGTEHLLIAWPERGDLPQGRGRSCNPSHHNAWEFAAALDRKHVVLKRLVHVNRDLCSASTGTFGDTARMLPSSHSYQELS